MRYKETNTGNTTMFGGRSTTTTMDFRIDAEMVGEMIERATEAYANPAVSAVREVFSNAWDATKKAGGDTIKIELPSTLNNNVLSIIDYGDSMTPDVINDVFLSYGRSTKGTSLDETGSKGMGAKAPFALVPTFAMIARSPKCTFKCDAVRNPNTIPQLTNISVVEETNPIGVRGTTVSIPLGGLPARLRARCVSTALQLAKYSIGMNVELVNTVDCVTEIFDVLSKHDDEIKNISQHIRPFNNDFLHAGSIPCDGNNLNVYVNINSMVDNVCGGNNLVRDTIREANMNSNDIARYVSMKLANTFINPSRHNKERIAFSLSGFLYGGDSNQPTPDIIVELLPGFVDFPSSRDGITNNNRLTAFVNHLERGALVLNDGDVLTPLLSMLLARGNNTELVPIPQDSGLGELLSDDDYAHKITCNWVKHYCDNNKMKWAALNLIEYFTVLHTYYKQIATNDSSSTYAHLAAAKNVVDPTSMNGTVLSSGHTVNIPQWVPKLLDDDTVTNMDFMLFRSGGNGKTSAVALDPNNGFATTVAINAKSTVNKMWREIVDGAVNTFATRSSKMFKNLVDTIDSNIELNGVMLNGERAQYKMLSSRISSVNSGELEPSDKKDTLVFIPKLNGATGSTSNTGTVVGAAADREAFNTVVEAVSMVTGKKLINQTFNDDNPLCYNKTKKAGGNEACVGYSRAFTFANISELVCELAHNQKITEIALAQSNGISYLQRHDTFGDFRDAIQVACNTNPEGHSTCTEPNSVANYTLVVVVPRTVFELFASTTLTSDIITYINNHDVLGFDTTNIVLVQEPRVSFLDELDNMVAENPNIMYVTYHPVTKNSDGEPIVAEEMRVVIKPFRARRYMDVTNIYRHNPAPIETQLYSVAAHMTYLSEKVKPVEMTKIAEHVIATALRDANITDYDTNNVVRFLGYKVFNDEYRELLYHRQYSARDFNNLVRMLPPDTSIRLNDLVEQVKKETAPRGESSLVDAVANIITIALPYTSYTEKLVESYKLTQCVNMAIQDEDHVVIMALVGVADGGIESSIMPQEVAAEMLCGLCAKANITPNI